MSKYNSPEKTPIKKWSSRLPQSPTIIEPSSQSEDQYLFQNQRQDTWKTINKPAPESEYSYENSPSSCIDEGSYASEDKNSESQPSQIFQPLTVRHETNLQPTFINALLPLSTNKTVRGCNCQNSKCLQNYCVCLLNGSICSPDVCSCKSCQNKQLTALHRENLNKVLKLKLSQNGKRCHCKKSKCLKNYCECHSSGQKCSKECECLDCCNQEDLSYEKMEGSKKRKPNEYDEANKENIPRNNNFLPNKLFK